MKKTTNNLDIFNELNYSRSLEEVQVFICTLKEKSGLMDNRPLSTV